MISDFTYLKPGSAKEALKMLAEHQDDGKIICGGQSLLIIMRQGLVTPEYVIDIKRLKDLNYITFDAKDGLKMGATTTHRTIEKSALVKEKYPVLVEMEEKLASIQVRNWGTIGGNLAHADAAGDPAPVLMAMGGSVKVASASGERVIPLDEFYTDLFETAMNHDEMIVEVHSAPASRQIGDEVPEIQPPRQRPGDRCGGGHHHPERRRRLQGRAHRPRKRGIGHHEGERGREGADRRQTERRGLRKSRRGGRGGVSAGCRYPRFRRIPAPSHKGPHEENGKSSLGTGEDFRLTRRLINGKAGCYIST